MSPINDGKYIILVLTECCISSFSSDVCINQEIIQSDQGGGEALAPTLEVNPLHLVCTYIFNNS